MSADSTPRRSDTRLDTPFWAPTSAIFLHATTIVVACLFAVVHKQAVSHEYWIEPARYTYNIGETGLAHLRNGEDFSGASLPFLPARLVSAKVHAGDESFDLDGRLGDLPALNYIFQTPGLHAIAVTTKHQTLRYTDPDKLKSFIAAHGLHDFFHTHKKQLNAKIAVVESYTRYAKTLVNVIDKDEDTEAQAAASTPNLTRPVLKFDWVLDSDTSPSADGINLRLLHEGRGFGNRHTEVYFKSDGKEVTRVVYETDDDGRLTVLTPASGTYLVNAVRPQMIDARKSMISTDWASLTFSVEKK